jgi:hypothetical protein
MMNKNLIGRTIIDVGKDWIQLDDGSKLYIEG